MNAVCVWGQIYNRIIFAKQKNRGLIEVLISAFRLIYLVSFVEKMFLQSPFTKVDCSENLIIFYRLHDKFAKEGDAFA